MKTNNILSALFFLFSILCNSSLHAQSLWKRVGNVTLKECLERGLEKNFSIKMIYNKEEVLSNNATRANAGMLPTLDLQASYSGNLKTEREISRDTGLTARDNNGYNQMADAGLNLNWTLFDGFSILTNYKQLQLLKEQGELQTRITIEDFIASLTAEYYNFIQQKIRLKNFHYSMSLSRERMRIVEARYNIGNFSRLDYQQAKVDFNADSTLYMKQQEALKTSLIRLNELMANEDVTNFIGIRDTAIDVNPNLNYERLWNETLKANSSLLEAGQNTELAKMDYKKIMSRDYPYVRLNAGYGYTLNRYAATSVKQRDNWGFNAGVTLGFNIFDGKRSMQKRNAKLAIEYAELEKENLKLSLKAQLSNLWQAYENNWQILLLERQNLIAAQDNYDIAYERYMLGDLSGFEMREAQESLIDAEERILTAEYDTKMCEISLLLISGNVLYYLN